MPDISSTDVNKSERVGKGRKRCLDSGFRQANCASSMGAETQSGQVTRMNERRKRKSWYRFINCHVQRSNVSLDMRSWDGGGE